MKNDLLNFYPIRHIRAFNAKLAGKNACIVRLDALPHLVAQIFNLHQWGGGGGLLSFQAEMKKLSFQFYTFSGRPS